MVTFSIISRLFSIYFLFMGRRKRTYKITSIIVQAGDEVADFKLDSNEDFEIPKNQINKIMNNMKKQIDSIIESIGNKIVIKDNEVKFNGKETKGLEAVVDFDSKYNE